MAHATPELRLRRTRIFKFSNPLVAANQTTTSVSTISKETENNDKSEIKSSTSIQSDANTPVSASLISAICKTTTLLKSGTATGFGDTTDPVNPPVSEDPDVLPPSKFMPTGPGGIYHDPTDPPVTPTPPSQPLIRNVYGASIDVQNAERILGTSNYNYIETDTDGFVLPAFTSNDIILGGTGTLGGIGDVNLNGATRLAGIDRNGTINAIKEANLKWNGAKNVYGASKDLENAENILGDYGYNYIHTDSLDFQIPKFTSNDIIVGGTGATGGIGPGIQLNGAIRLAGANEQLTAQAINNYNSPKYVYGNTIDKQNVENILGDTGYTYINTDDKDFHNSGAYTSNDIILGGSTCTGITDDELNGAIRLAGATREDTANLVRNYSVSKNVYGASIDLQNAKRILGTVGYNYIETDKSGFIMPKFTENDIILGGTGTIGGIGNVNENGAKRLADTDRAGTIQKIREYAGVKRVYGNSTDIASAKNVLGYTNYTYITVDSNVGITDSLTSNDIVLGGEPSTKIADSQLNGAIRLAGINRELTGQTIFNYNTPKCVYGNKIDIDNARSILGDAGYDYIYTDRDGFQNPGSFTSNDIILGGSACTGITDNELNDAIRIAGADRDGTIQAIKDYSTATNIYGTTADIDNVKGFLGTTGFNYIYTDKPGYVKIQGATYNDILLGGSGVPGGIGDIPCVKENRLAGANRDLTAMEVWDHFGINSIPNQSWGAVNRDPSQMYVSAIDDATGKSISIAKGTPLQIYRSDGDYYDCNYGTNGAKILKLYLTKCDAPAPTPVSPTPGTGGGTNLSEIERFCEEPITSTWGISDSTVEEWFLKQNTAQPVITRYGLNSTNIKAVTAAVKAAGVSPVFFYTYTVNEGGGQGGFINHWGKYYYSQHGGDTAINAATGDANYLATYSKIMNQQPAWTDVGPNYVDFVPQSVKNSGNASYANMPSGSIGRVYIAATAATTWEVYYPNGLLKEYNKVQNYAAPLKGVMNDIKAMGGNP